MFNNIDSKEFGAYLCKLRKKLKLTQANISETTGINPDTIRKIENGSVIPKYDTLALLTLVFKIDLIKKFSEYQSTNDLITLSSKIDYYLIDNDIRGIESVYDYLNENLETLFGNVINRNEVLQLIYYLEVLQLHMKGCNFDYDSTIKKLNEALSLTIKDFTVSKLKFYRFNSFELRILILYAVMWFNFDQFKMSNKILFILLDWLDYVFAEEALYIKYKIKIYFNLSYNYFRLYNYDLSLDYADKGIEIAKASGLFNDLHPLYYRKFTAELKLEKSNYLNSLKKCIQIMDILENRNLLEQYIMITKDKYGIDASVYIP